MIPSSQILHSYPFWWCISIGRASEVVNSCIFFAKRNQALGGRPSCLLEREGLVSKDLKLESVGALKPLGQKHTTWIRTGNLSLTKCNTPTTESRLQTGYIISRNIAVYEIEMQKRKLQSRWHVGECCCCSPTLALGSAMEIWLEVINEMCLQRLNLSSTQDSVFNQDLALLQHRSNRQWMPREWISL